MSRILRKVGLAAVICMLLLVMAWGVLVWRGSRSSEPPSMAERRQAYSSALNWFKHHEQQVLSEGNAALWWMLARVAELQNEPYLKDLVRRASAEIYVNGNASVPWRRMVEPHAAVVHDPALTVGLTPYQKFFYHAVTCSPVELDESKQTTEQFLLGNACKPMLSKVFGRDNVCTTHQLMGLELVRQMGCSMPAGVPQLRKELLEDVALQMRVDPMFKDAYIQRVLMLYWLSGPQAVEAVWLKQVFAQQHPDGGWSGDRVFQGAPRWFQPWVFRQIWQKFWPSNYPPEEPKSDFHATAQGLLLSALSLANPGPRVAP